MFSKFHIQPEFFWFRALHYGIQDRSWWFKILIFYMATQTEGDSQSSWLNDNEEVAIKANTLNWWDNTKQEINQQWQRVHFLFSTFSFSHSHARTHTHTNTPTNADIYLKEIETKLNLKVLQRVTFSGIFLYPATLHRFWLYY